jgi:hypothetical protein
MLNTFFKYLLWILDRQKSRQSAKLLIQSSDGTPSHFAGERVGSPNSDEGTDTVAL